MKEEMMAELIKQRDIFVSLFDEKRHDHLLSTGKQTSQVYNVKVRHIHLLLLTNILFGLYRSEEVVL